MDPINLLQRIVFRQDVGLSVGPIRMGIMMSALAVVVGAVIWYAYPKEKEGVDQISAPILRADTTPYKIVPDDPGGMEIPHMDSTIYETLQARKSMERGEKVMASAELPFAKDKIFSEIEPAAGTAKKVNKTSKVLDLTEVSMDKPDMPNTVVNVDGVENDEFINRARSLEDIIVKYVDVSKDVHSSEFDKKTQPKIIDLTENMGWDVKKPASDKAFKTVGVSTQQEAPSPKMTSQVKKMSPMAAVKPLRKPANIAKTTQKAGIIATRLSTIEPVAGSAKTKAPRINLMGDGYRIQLGSLRSETGARILWQDMQNKFPTHLSSLNLYIQKVDLGERGMYFRVQAGPLEQIQAQAICDVIKTRRPGGCLVIRR